MKTSHLGKNIFALLTTLALASACGPRDVAQEDDGGGDGGGPLTVTAAGQRPSTCPAKFTDDNFVRSPVENDAAIFSGKITAALGAGNKSCVRIGAVVNLQNGKNAPSRGQVTVTKIEILPVAALSDSHARYLGLSNGDEVRALADKEIEAAKAIFNAKGMVSITYFTYNKGSATGGEVVVPNTQEIITLDKDGDRAPGCPADYKDSIRLITPADKTTEIITNKITATMEAGDRNCFRIGTEVDLTPAKETPAFTRAKIVKVQIVPKDKLDATQAKALAIDEKTIIAAADAKISAVKFDALGLVHITYFRVLGAPEPEPEIPVIDAKFYAAYVSVLKEKLVARLTSTLTSQAVEWDPTSLEITYARAVEVISSSASDKILVPGYRITFKTMKGSTLVLFNYSSKNELLFLMDAALNSEKITDIEGIVIGETTTWSSVSKAYAPLGALLFNETTNSPTKIVLDPIDFAPLVIDVVR